MDGNASDPGQRTARNPAWDDQEPPHGRLFKHQVEPS
jgi:hypothetical protein